MRSRTLLKPLLSREKFSWALQLSLTVTIAFFIAEFFTLQFAASAAIIAMLASITLKNKPKILPAIVEWYLSIAIGSVLIILYEILNYNIFVLFLMLLIYYSILLAFQFTECMVISTVIVTHYFGAANLTLAVVLNEFSLLTIGVMVSAILTLLVRSNSNKKSTH